MNAKWRIQFGFGGFGKNRGVGDFLIKNEVSKKKKCKIEFLVVLGH